MNSKAQEKARAVLADTPRRTKVKPRLLALVVRAADHTGHLTLVPLWSAQLADTLLVHREPTLGKRMNEIKR